MVVHCFSNPNIKWFDVAICIMCIPPLPEHNMDTLVCDSQVSYSCHITVIEPPIMNDDDDEVLLQS